MKTKVDNVICAMVETFLPKFSSQNLGLFVEIDCGFHDHKKENDIRRFIQFLFIRPSNHTQVLYRESVPPEYLWNGKEFKWEQTSNHDSCWSSDGLRNIFKIRCNSIEMLESWGAERKDIYEHHTFSIFHSPTYVLIGSKENIKVQGLHGKEETFNWKVRIEKRLSIQEASQYFPKLQEKGYLQLPLQFQND